MSEIINYEGETFPAASGESPCIEDRDGIPAAILKVILSRGKYNTLRSLYRLINIWGAEQRATVAKDGGVEAAICAAYPTAPQSMGEVEDRAIEQRGFRKGFAAASSKPEASAANQQAGEVRPWEELRAEILHGLDGFTNEQTNDVLRLIDFYTPDAAPIKKNKGE